jgi:hypothetical protein
VAGGRQPDAAAVDYFHHQWKAVGSGMARIRFALVRGNRPIVTVLVVGDRAGEAFGHEHHRRSAITSTNNEHG